MADVRLFLAGLIDWRRPLSMRTLDLVVVLSFVASLYAFNRGDVFWSTPLIYPPMIYLTVRMVWIGWRRRRASSTSASGTCSYWSD